MLTTTAVCEYPGHMTRTRLQHNRLDAQCIDHYAPHDIYDQHAICPLCHDVPRDEAEAAEEDYRRMRGVLIIMGAVAIALVATLGIALFVYADDLAAWLR